jgi:hypothetical protein
MGANVESVARSFWQSGRMKLVAIALVALLTWAYYYVQHVPVARDFSKEDAQLVAVNRDAAVRLGGIPAGDILTFRTVAARRLILTLPAESKMLSPEAAPFKAKSLADAPSLPGFACTKDSVMLEAQTKAGETVSVRLVFPESSATKLGGALIFDKAPTQQFQNGLRFESEQSDLRLTVDYSRSDSAPAAGRMILCDAGTAAMLGHAEFEIPARNAAVAEFLDIAPGPDATAAFDFPGAMSRVAVNSIAGGLLDDNGAFTTQRLACAAAGHAHLWGKILPRVDLTDCTLAGLYVSGFDLNSGLLNVSVRPALFQNFQDKDSAHYVSNAMSGNLIVQLLILALLTGTIIPWVIRQFKRKAAPAEPLSPRHDNAEAE